MGNQKNPGNCRNNFHYYRQDCEHINDVVKPYDWTYTTGLLWNLFRTSFNNGKYLR